METKNKNWLLRQYPGFVYCLLLSFLKFHKLPVFRSTVDSVTWLSIRGRTEPRTSTSDPQEVDMGTSTSVMCVSRRCEKKVPPNRFLRMTSKKFNL